MPYLGGVLEPSENDIFNIIPELGQEQLVKHSGGRNPPKMTIENNRVFTLGCRRPFVVCTQKNKLFMMFVNCLQLQ